MGLGPISLLGTLASTTLQMAGQSQQAKAAMQAANYNNTLAQNEATNREAETAQGITRQRAGNRAALAELSNNLATTGLRTDTGTPLVLSGESAARMELGIADAARSASMQAHAIRAQGQMGLWESGQQQQAARYGMAASALSGIGKAFGQYNEGSYQGLYPRIGKL